MTDGSQGSGTRELAGHASTPGRDAVEESPGRARTREEPAGAVRAAGGPLWELGERDWRDLSQRAATAIRRARARRRPVLASISVAATAPLDPSAIVAASRRPGERWFCFEQPARDGWALAVLGSVARIEGKGRDRFRQVAASWRELVRDAVAEPPAGGGQGLVAVGGLAFAADGCGAPHWRGFAASALDVPELALARNRDQVVLTLTVAAQGDDTAEDLLGRIRRRLDELRDAPLPLLDPDPLQRVQVASTLAPEHYEAAVARAVERIAAGGLEKIVLAREVQAIAASAHDPVALLGALRSGFADCYVGCAGVDDAAFVVASPELLIRREGQRASTVALAGSTRRSADPAVDDHLGERLLHDPKERQEHAIVARRIEATLAPLAVWVAAPDEPSIVRIANIQHLGTPIRAQLARPVGVLELAGLLHPTPAVGGEPAALATPLIPALEGLDRGWYAGPLGWMDANEDGELCVALRCALLRGAIARCYAGVGVVRDSDPARELAETEIKLQALLPLIAG